MNPTQKGQALIEYAIVCAIVVMVLLLGDPDMADQMIAAFKARIAVFSMLLGAP